MVTDSSTSNQQDLTGFLFCLDLSLSRSIDHHGLLIVICICYLVVSNPLAVRPTFHLAGSLLYVVDFSES